MDEKSDSPSDERKPIRKTRLRRKTPLGIYPGEPRPCPNCGRIFRGRSEHSTYGQKYCSNACRDEARATAARELWPSEEVMRRHVVDECLSDAAIGRLYGHTYEWSRWVRKAYDIPAVPKPPHREIKHGRYIGREAFYLKAKAEERCRNCGKIPRGRGLYGSLHAHHAVPRSVLRKGNDPRNCLPLCFECHQGWHDRTLTIFRWAFTDEEWRYLSGLQLLGQRTEWWLDAHYPPEKAPPPLGYWDSVEEFEAWRRGE